MENAEKKNPSARNKIQTLTGAFILIFLLYYSIMVSMAPGAKLKEIMAKYDIGHDSQENTDERLFTDSAYISLLREKSFLESGITMAGTDSVYMIINISDSTASLGISGVTVHSARISSIRISKILRKGNSYAVQTMLASPMTIVEDASTIKKEPIMVKMAPKDTSEFRPDVIPDTSDYEPISYILKMDNGLKVHVYQEVADFSHTDRNSLIRFDMNDRLVTAWNAIKSIAALKIPEYHPFIKIRIPKSDAKILYRAIPRKGQIAVYF